MSEKTKNLFNVTFEKDNKELNYNCLKAANILKPNIAGSNHQDSLLMFYKKVKNTKEIPRFTKLVNIASIFKGRGEKTNLENGRGIFRIDVFRDIFLRLIYNDIDLKMSD